jgi:protease-4
MSQSPSLLARLGRGLDGLRRFVVNVVFFGLILGLLGAFWTARPRVPDGAALVLDPRGVIVEQLSSDPAGRLLGQMTGVRRAKEETLLKDLLDAMRLAKDDPRIKGLYLHLDDMSGAGMSKLRDLREGIVEFKRSGKKVVSYGDSYQQGAYYLAALADEVYLHPEGLVFIRGFGGYRAYYKDGLDRLGVDVHVFRVGEYKSAVEPYLRPEMSPETKESLLDVYGDLWRDWVSDVAEARRLKSEEITAFTDGLPDRIRAVQGDLAKAALQAKLVDRLAPRDEVRRRLIQLVGEDKDTRSFRQVDFETYLAAREGDRAGRGRGQAVAVVVAKGDILDGTQPPGTIGGDSTAALVRRARQDDAVKAIVLRVDSPGGSAFASEIIRRECELAREAGKPVVVSMGSVAASGGYWISTASDEIWASPASITGSIGIFAVFPTVDRPLAKYLGVHVDGVGTTRFSDALRADRPMDPAVAEILQEIIDHGYESFLERVAKARRMSRDQVDKIARGRIWSGEDAKRLGLVDQLGGLPQAIASAAARAKLGKDYRVLYVEKERSLRERLLGALLAAAARVGVRDEGHPPSSRAPAPVTNALAAVRDEVGRVALWNDPSGVYAHCLCGEDWP